MPARTPAGVAPDPVKRTSTHRAGEGRPSDAQGRLGRAPRESTQLRRRPHLPPVIPVMDHRRRPRWARWRDGGGPSSRRSRGLELRCVPTSARSWATVAPPRVVPALPTGCSGGVPSLPCGVTVPGCVLPVRLRGEGVDGAAEPVVGARLPATGAAGNPVGPGRAVVRGGVTARVRSGAGVSLPGAPASGKGKGAVPAMISARAGRRAPGTGRRRCRCSTAASVARATGQHHVRGALRRAFDCARNLGLRRDTWPSDTRPRLPGGHRPDTAASRASSMARRMTL
jgi:hypothetical protein